MNPNQPPQTPPPAPGYPPQPPAGPPSPQQPGYSSPYPPHPPQPQQAPQQPQQPQAASWYTPPEVKGADRPASASDYVQRVKPANQDPTGFGTPGAGESHSIDYLNQLAGSPAASRTVTPPNQKIILIGVGLFLALSLAIFLLIFSNQKGPAGPPAAQTLYTTIFNNAQIAKESDKNIKDSTLSGINSSYNSQLLNDLTALKEPLAKGGINTKNLERDAKDKKAYDKTLQKLNDARLNAVFDHAYASELNYEIQSIMMLMQKIEKYSHNKALVNYVKKDISNYKTIKEALKQYNDSLITDDY